MHGQGVFLGTGYFARPGRRGLSMSSARAVCDVCSLYTRCPVTCHDTPCSVARALRIERASTSISTPAAIGRVWSLGASRSTFGTPSFGYIVLFTAFTCLVSVLGYRHVWPYLAEFSGAIGETVAHCVAFKYFLSQS